MAGVVRAHGAAKKLRSKLIIGSEIVLADGLKLVVFAVDRQRMRALLPADHRARRAAPERRISR